jgi:molecular chaperone GrpE (heat shock protein)
MRIKRFLENAQMDIASDRVEEILKELKELTAYLDDKNKSILSLTTELNNYKNKSQKSNDQIDDSISALQIVKNDFDNSISKLDTVINNITDYSQEGRKFLYSENK